jgi:hypothetical protein
VLSDPLNASIYHKKRLSLSYLRENKAQFRRGRRYPRR